MSSVMFISSVEEAKKALDGKKVLIAVPAFPAKPKINDKCTYAEYFGTGWAGEDCRLPNNRIGRAKVSFYEKLSPAVTKALLAKKEVAPVDDDISNFV